MRTTPREEVEKRTDGLSVFLVDMREAVGNGLEIKPIRTMINHATTEIFFDNLRIPADSLVGEEGKGFSYAMAGLDGGRINIAAAALGGAQSAFDIAKKYSNERVAFEKPISSFQSIHYNH